ncbi:MAG: arsinothricin resistance N-acetyltransferase ArsN1 family B [Pseudomonadota bacterium]
MTIRSVTIEDAASIASIYNHYIEHTVITFEESSVESEEIAQRIEESQDQGLPWFVAEGDKGVEGYAYASKWQGRCGYRFSVEVTVYLDPSAGGKGLGTLLYRSLLWQLKEQGFRSVIAGISLPNEASVALHEKFGLEKVGHFSEVGFKFSNWVDVGYWQGTL